MKTTDLKFTHLTPIYLYVKYQNTLARSTITLGCTTHCDILDLLFSICMLLIDNKKKDNWRIVMTSTGLVCKFVFSSQLICIFHQHSIGLSKNGLISHTLYVQITFSMWWFVNTKQAIQHAIHKGMLCWEILTGVLQL